MPPPWTWRNDSFQRGSQGGTGIDDSLKKLGAAVRAAAGKRPDRVALRDETGARTYAELAAMLEEPGTAAAPRRAARISPSIADAEAILRAGFRGESVLLLDQRTTDWELERAERIFVGANDDGRPSVGLCSSGSSGLPKVVELEWESLLRNADSFAGAAGYREDDVLWCTTPLAHLYCLGVGLLGGLLSGATVLLGKGMLEAGELAETAADAAPTVLLSVPFLFNRYLGLLADQPQVARTWSLRMAIAAGEPVSPQLVTTWREATGTPLRSHYGLTEGGQITLADGGEDEGVGAPLPDVEVRIGADGEIGVRRRPPARPYRVLGGELGEDGWYETGDVGHLDAAGNLHVTGRADRRINIAGKKVDPAEVEEALAACAGVEDCAVAAIEGAHGAEIVAFVHLGEDGGEEGDAEIRAELAGRLSPHKLPRRFIHVQEIPRTLTGKVRRGDLLAGLAVPVETPAEWGRGDMLELVRRETAATILGHQSSAAIDPRRSFKELGFDSLTAVSLCERLAQESDLPVHATAVFDHPTPVALAAHLDALARGGEREHHRAPAAAFSGEPVAIVGMACRFPGGIGRPSDLWDLVARGGEAISEFPTDRGWDLERLFDPDPDNPGTSYARRGGFLAGVDLFDAELFGVSPREALAMDPQQRLLLEAAWEAFEDAGLDPLGRNGTDTGVFAGVMIRDYDGAALPESSEGHLTTGLAESVVSGRVAYTLGLEGPAITVNTACSSSLVAMHLACQSLRAGECSLALAGGVSVMATPAQFVQFSRQRGLARDGRCKAFGAGADGTVWSEGVGLLVLEPLSEARRRGRRVLATIVGSAVNQDGASNGLSAPRGPAQERVIRQALASARLEPGDIDAVEAHGTGTSLGDPIEAEALISSLGRDRERPLRLGSVKSNLGHTLAAAGAAGTIKMVEAMRHATLPRTLHADDPSPHVKWDAGAVELLTESAAWPASERPRRAGVSSFGISGTNAHLILEQAPAEPGPAEVAPSSPGRWMAWTVSGSGPQALRAQAERLHAHIAADPDLDPADVGFTLATARAQLEHRAVLLGPERDALLSSLASLAAGEAPTGTIGSRTDGGGTAFLFTGQGAQRAGMGRELHALHPAFADALDEVCAALDPHLDLSLRELLLGKQGAEEDALLDRTELTQPALFALEVSLFRLLESCGVRPDFLVGHSVGEIAAAHVSGVLTLAEAARLVAARGALMGGLPEGGAMVAIGAGEEEVRSAIAESCAGRLSVAAVNGPDSTVVSGEREDALEVAAAFARRGHKTSELRVSHAFHSHRMDPMLDELVAVAEELSPAAPGIPIVSNLTGRPLEDEQATSSRYWARQAREPVRFLDSVRFLAGEGVTRFIELGPDGVLTAMVGECLPEEEGEAVRAVPLMRRKQAEAETFAAGLAAAHVAGVPVEWSGFFAGSGARRVQLPTYAFQRERYWIGARSGGGESVGDAGLLAPEHPLLGAATAVAGRDEWLFSGRLSVEAHPWLADHRVEDSVVVPGVACLELASWVAAEVGLEAVEELVQEGPVVLPEEGAVLIQLTVGPEDEDGWRPFALHARPESGEAEWAPCASGSLAPGKEHPAADGLASWPPPGAEQVPAEDVYERLADAGIEYGPAFRGLRSAWRREAEVFAEVGVDPEGGGRGFALHPALLDAALHAVCLADVAADAIPFAWSDAWLCDRPPAGDGLRVRIAPSGEGAFSVDAVDLAGTPAFSVGRLALRPLDRAALRGGAAAGDSLFRIEWREPEGAEGAAADAPPWELWRCEAEHGPDPATAARLTAERALARVQETLAEEGEAAAPLAVITRNALAVEAGERPDLAVAPVWGLVRSAQAEHPDRFRLIDTDGSEASEGALSAALDIAGEPQLALRGGEVLAPRLARVSEPALPEGDPAEPWRLDAEPRGALDRLGPVPAPRALRPLAGGEVRIAVHAAGLNFRDVLIALDAYPGDAPIGSEAAGLVVEVGDGVGDLAPGDRVFGRVPEAFGPLAVAERHDLARVPDAWSFAEAAATPIAALTALYGLVDLAELRAGERVLIHSAAGGVGGYAVQLALHAGAEVFATAHPAKWGRLRELGVSDDRIASSRDAGFREEFMRATGGEGVDVVLNSLAGELVDASLDLLPRGGRFLEMGKADVRDPDRVGASHPGVAYRAYDLADAGPERTAAMLDELLGLFERGALRHPPIASWDARRGAQAFRLMSQGRHTGKVVLAVPQPPGPTATTLITGGTGALGALVARHLAGERGARHLLLASRRGAEAEGAAALKDELRELGAEVTIVACDVSDRSQLEALLASVPADRPLRTVVHAAGAIDDGLVESLTPERLESVFAAKALAAWNLHELTRHMPLTELVFFSSVAGALGGPAQANYAAANAFLDALAERRQAEGLAATSIAWGLWQRESRMTAGLGEADRSRMSRSGALPIADESGLAMLDLAGRLGEPSLVANPLDLKTLRSLARNGAMPPLFRGLVRAPVSGTGELRGSLARRLAGLGEAERERLLLDLVLAEAAGSLGHASPDLIDPDRAFKEIGFDSLAAVELRNRLKALSGLRLPSTVVFDQPNVRALAAYLGLRLGEEGEEARPAIELALDGLEAQLAALDGDARARAVERLKEILGEAAEGAANGHEDLDAASDDEVIRLIEAEFGSI